MRAFLVLFVALAMASDVVILDESNFDSIVNGEKNVFVEFFGALLVRSLIFSLLCHSQLRGVATARGEDARGLCAHYALLTATFLAWLR